MPTAAFRGRRGHLLGHIWAGGGPGSRLGRHFFAHQGPRRPSTTLVRFDLSGAYEHFGQDALVIGATEGKLMNEGDLIICLPAWDI